jgi:hypothetical protein
MYGQHNLVFSFHQRILNLKLSYATVVSRRPVPAVLWIMVGSRSKHLHYKQF